MVPGLAAIIEELGASVSTIKYTLTLFFVTYAGSLLIYGPLSDRIGRKRTLVYSLIIYCLGSLTCAASTSASILIIGRMIQGLGAGGGTVIAWAVARDVFEGPQLLRVTSLINAGRSVIPAIAPAIGGVIVDGLGWKFTFIATGVLGSLVLGSTVVFLPETLPRTAHSVPLSDVVRTYLYLFKSHRFLAFALCAACSLGTWFAFLAGSPTVFMKDLGLSPAQFGLCPTLMASGSVVGGVITANKAVVFGNDRLSKCGLAALLFGAAATLTFPVLGIMSVPTIMVPMFFVSLGCGMVFPAAAASAMQMCGGRAGSGFAVIGFLSMTVAATSTALATEIPGETIFIFPSVMLGWVLASGTMLALANGSS